MEHSTICLGESGAETAVLWPMTAHLPGQPPQSPAMGRGCTALEGLGCCPVWSRALLISLLRFVTIPEREIIFNFVIITTSCFHCQPLSVCCCTRTKCGINTSLVGRSQDKDWGSPGKTMLQVHKGISSKTSPKKKKNQLYETNPRQNTRKKNLPPAQHADRWTCTNCLHTSTGAAQP